jgi:hypothetical protein
MSRYAWALGFEGPRDRFDYPVSGKLNDHGVAPYLASVFRFVRAPLKGFKKILFLNTIKYIFVFKEGLNHGSCSA